MDWTIFLRVADIINASIPTKISQIPIELITELITPYTSLGTTYCNTSFELPLQVLHQFSDSDRVEDP